MSVFEVAIVSVYLFCVGFIFSYSLIQLDLIRLYRKGQKLSKDFDPNFLPRVCVQLPVYNERYVVERLIDAVLGLDYPAELVEVQILDDSTDDTTVIISKKLEQANSDFKIDHIRRENREGYKAGALKYGLELTNAEFVAIFDSDFVPDPAFLKRTIARFKNDRVGVVQSRWTHLNENFDWMTQLQAFGLNAHFTIEQTARMFGEHFLNFNGTAGIWRKSCIEDAGNWSQQTLTEDLDLSYRAQLKGWRIVFDESVESPAELPVTMGALKSQQFRWTKGAAQCAKKHLLTVLKASKIKLSTRVHALFHLMNSFVFIAILLASLLSIPLMIIRDRYENTMIVDLLGTIFIISLLVLGFYYYTAYRRAKADGSFGEFILTYILFLSASMGMSFHNTKAIFEGYAGIKSGFVRTPKFNLRFPEQWKSNAYIAQISAHEVLVEMFLGMVFLAAVAYGIFLQQFAFIIFHMLLAGGFSMLTFTSIAQNRALGNHHSTMKESTL